MRRPRQGWVTVETAVDILGDFNIFPRNRCAAKFGWNGAPSKDPVVPFTEPQLLRVARVFRHVHLLVRYAPLSQVVSHSRTPLTIPRTILASENDSTESPPQFRLVAWNPKNPGKSFEKALRSAGLRTQVASFTTGLSALLLSQGYNAEGAGKFKLRLRDGAATITRSSPNELRVERIQPLFSAPPIHDVRPMMN